MADLFALGFSYYVATCNEPRNRSFCGHYHVLDGAYKIGIVGIVLAFAQIGCGILFQGHRHWLGSVLLITGCISMLVFFCLIIAKQVRKPLLFLPFLIVEGIGLLVLWCFEVLLFVYLLFFHKVRPSNAETDADSDQSIFDRTNDYDAHSALDALAGLSTLAVCFILLGNVIVLFFTHWIYWIVWRAWRFIRREVAYKQQPITKTIPATISTNQSPTGGDPVTQHQQNPTSVAGGSIPSSFTDTVPLKQVHTKGVEESVPSTLIDIDPVIPEQEVPTNAVDEQLPTTSNPIIPQVPDDLPGRGSFIIIWPPGAVGPKPKPQSPPPPPPTPPPRPRPASRTPSYAGSASTNGAERSHSSSLSSPRDDSGTHQQPVHTDAVEESLPTSSNVPATDQQQDSTDGVGTTSGTSDSVDDQSIPASLPSTSSDNAPATHQQPDLTADGVEGDPSNLAMFHNGD